MLNQGCMRTIKNHGSVFPALWNREGPGHSLSLQGCLEGPAFSQGCGLNLFGPLQSGGLGKQGFQEHTARGNAAIGAKTFKKRHPAGPAQGHRASLTSQGCHCALAVTFTFCEGPWLVVTQCCGTEQPSCQQVCQIVGKLSNINLDLTIVVTNGINTYDWAKGQGKGRAFIVLV